MATKTRQKRGGRPDDGDEARAVLARHVDNLLGADPAARAAGLRRVLTVAPREVLDLLAGDLIGRLAGRSAAARAAAAEALTVVGPAVLGPLAAACTDRRVRVAEGAAAVLAAVGPRLTQSRRDDLAAELAVPAMLMLRSGQVARARALLAAVDALRDPVAVTGP